MSKSLSHNGELVGGGDPINAPVRKLNRGEKKMANKLRSKNLDAWLDEADEPEHPHYGDIGYWPDDEA